MRDNDLVTKALDLLGKVVSDRVTGFTGMAASVCFDAYGCVQCGVTPTTLKEGKVQDTVWVDVKRLKPLERLLPAPSFLQTKFGEENGCCDSRPDIK